MVLSPFDPCHHVLKALPPRIAGAILEVHHKTGAPVEIVIMVSVSAMSAALHGMVIRTPDGGLMPTSLYCLGIAPPVCGKSAAMREFYKAIREFDSGLSERRDACADERDKAPLRDVLQLDATWSSLLEALHGRCNGLTIADDDCIDQLKGDVLRKRGKLNRMFDGPVKESLTRRDKEPLVAFYPSVGICFLTQPDIHAEHQIATRYMDRKSGLASRFIYAYTLSGLGPALPSLPTPCLDEIHALSTLFLDQRVRAMIKGDMKRIELILSPEAAMRWSQIKRDIDLRINSEFDEVQDSARRATEKVWRVAALIHCYGYAVVPANPATQISVIPPISVQAMEAAWSLVHWSLGQFSRAFPPARPKPVRSSRVRERQIEETNAAKGHLYRHLLSVGGDTMPWSLAQELSWLSAHKFKTVMAHMKSTGQVEVIDGKLPVVRFHPAFFAEMRFVPPFSADESAL